MRCILPILLSVLVWPCVASGQEPPKPPAIPRRENWKATLALPSDLWVDATEATIGTTSEWTNKVEIADLNADGRPDLLFANGGDYDKAGELVSSRVFQNEGPGLPFREITTQVFGDQKFFARVIKVQDVNGDGRADVLVGTTFDTQSRLFLGMKNGFADGTKSHLPDLKGNCGDVEFGDVDHDGDLDLVLSEWGPGSPMKNDGGRTRLWLNDGQGHFTDATMTQMPEVLVRFCWELEFVDVDQDWDLDVLISSKRSSGSFLFENDGTGRFRDVTQGRLPQFTNNYEFEPMDVNGDGWLDLVTINDGRFTEHLFLSDQKQGFVDATATHWPASENPSFDDNMIAFLDYDSDGDADFIIGSLDGPERLLVNNGKGHFQAASPIMTGEPTRGTLAIALADLNGDHRLDLVHAQGEVKGATAERVFFGHALPPDTRAPTLIRTEIPTINKSSEGFSVRAQFHDLMSPARAFDFRSAVLRLKQDSQIEDVPFRWYGEYLWRADVKARGPGDVTYAIRIQDAAGNTFESKALSSAVR